MECNARNNNNQMTYLAVFPISQGLLRKLNIGTPLTQRPIYNMLNHGSAKQRLLAQGSTEVLLPWMERNQWQNRSLTCWTTDQACTEIQFQSCCLQNLRRMGLAFIVRWRGGYGLLWSIYGGAIQGGGKFWDSPLPSSKETSLLCLHVAYTNLKATCGPSHFILASDAVSTAQAGGGQLQTCSCLPEKATDRANAPFSGSFTAASR